MKKQSHSQVVANTNDYRQFARTTSGMLKGCALALMSLLLFATPALAQDEEVATFRTWAMTPPMGWNSWDCYYSSVTEKEVMQNAKYLVDNDLVKYGWEYVVVDIRWYCNHPSLGGGNYNQRGTQDYVLDEYGRYLPSPTRFPSCMKDGKNIGFKAMADSIHKMGLKFGIHIMRGVPQKVVGSSYKLKGSEATPWTQVYNGTTSPCTWLKDNLLVRNNEAGQLYYNSIMDLYAEWGVDFLKIDDLSRPFYTDEIHMIRKAIDQTGRPIVLSLSPGKTQYTYAQECLENANMWRMMDDLWDNWSAVDAVFNEAHAWENVTRPGNYADCDMLPLGQIAMTIADQGYTNADAGRWTNLSHNEQYTMMTLWGICHSPLFFGGEMTRNDAFTLSLLNNEEYHQMHKYGEDAHQVLNDEDLGHVVWTSTDPATGNRYLALFQRDNTRWIVGSKALYQSETVAYTTDGHAVDVDIEWPSGSKTLVLVVDDGGDNYNYDHGDWINPTLILRDGTEVELTGQYKTRDYTKSYFNRVYENKNVDNGGKMKVMGVSYDRGFSTDANAALFFQIPESMDVVRFKAMAAADDSGINQTGATTSIRFMVFNENPLTAEQQDYAARSGLISRTGTKSKTMECDVTGAQQLRIFVSNYGDGFAYDRADLINPVLIDADGKETSLTTLNHTSYTSDWGSLHKNKNVENGTLRVDGKSYDTGLGLNAECTLVYDLPEGHSYKTFRALCGYDSSCDTDNPNSTGTTMEFFFYVTKTQDFVFDLTQLGYGEQEAVPVYDIWAKESQGTATGTLRTVVPSHGAKLFRLGDNLPNDTQGPNNTGSYYQKADGKTGAALKSALSECIYNRTERSYGDLWNDFLSTDMRADGKVWDMYSATSNFTFGTDQDRGSGGTKEGEFYNREHSMPNSWFGGKVQPMYTDLHHMYPTDKLVNNKRSNYPFGEVGTASWQSEGGFSKLGSARSGLGYSGTVFEPGDEYKGDFARTYFYMVTCYDEKIADWYNNFADSRTMLDGKQYPGLADWALQMLMRWSEQDPVSEKELKRNEAVYKIQKNRNPFIDYPGLEQYVWGSKVGQAFSYDGSGVDGISTVSVKAGNGEQPIYNLRGQRMGNRHQLRRGIYVQGKKKIVVK